MSDVKVVLMSSDNQPLKETKTNKDGKFDFGLQECNSVCYLLSSKEGFNSNQSSTINIKEDESNYLEIPMKKTTINIHKSDNLMKLYSINPIHFDLSKYAIRPDAEVELNKIFNVLLQYPQMELDIRSHTDCRQSTEKNRILSQNRATSTMNWLISKGINKARLTAKGYGESQLLNKCSDGVKCSEEEHQANRRSEFIVTKI